VPVFVDTNVLVYARDEDELVKQPLAEAWRLHLWRTRTGRLSFQVLNEFYSTVLRKSGQAASEAGARADVTEYLAWDPIPQSRRTIASAWTLQDRYSMSYWDALIAAAASEGRCERLLTADLTDGQTYGGVTVVNPFVHPPS
jgi:predicted nucleic acid-binding protein